MEKIFEMLGVDKLDESKQSELKETLQTVIDVKSQEIAESKVAEEVEKEKERLTEEFETKFEEYKEDIVTKFSNFVDNILEEEMIIPENIVRFAHLGETYFELIEQFKTKLAIDEGYISDEVKNILREAKSEIESLREKLDEKTGKTLEMENDAAEMAAQLYIRSKCDGLTEGQKKRIITLIGDEIVKENIDKKFKTIVESFSYLKEEEDKDDDNTFEMKCEECGYKTTVSEKDLKESDEMKCEECGEAMKKVKESGDKKVEEGKGHSQVPSKKKVMNEEVNPWEAYKTIWLSGLKKTD